MKLSPNGDTRIGCYVCHCGSNIAAIVDCPAVDQYAAKLDGVVVSRDYKYMCSDPCLSRSTHAVDQMPMQVQLIGADGKVLHEVVSGWQVG